jgi:hypothetical protein
MEIPVGRFCVVFGGILLAIAAATAIGAFFYALWMTGQTIAAADDKAATPWLAPVFIVMFLPNVRWALYLAVPGALLLSIGGVLKYLDRTYQRSQPTLGELMAKRKGRFK